MLEVWLVSMNNIEPTPLTDPYRLSIPSPEPNADDKDFSRIPPMESLIPDKRS